MLVKDRKERLGLKTGVDEILEHPWFQDINIDAILNKKMQAPFVPNITSKQDLSNFDAGVIN